MTVTCVNVLKTISKKKLIFLAIQIGPFHRVENQRLIRKVRA